MLKNCSAKLGLVFFSCFLLAAAAAASGESITKALASIESFDEKQLVNNEEYVKDATYAAKQQKNILVLEEQQSALFSRTFFTWAPPIAAQQYLSHQLRYRIQQTLPVYTLISQPLDTAIGSNSLVTVFQSIQQYNPEVVVLNTGLNDGLKIFPVEHIESYLSAMIRQAKKQNAKVILLGSQLPFFYDFDYSRQFGEMYQKLAHEHNICYLAFPPVSPPFVFFPMASHFKADRVTTEVNTLLNGNSRCAPPLKLADTKADSA